MIRGTSVKGHSENKGTTKDTFHISDSVLVYRVNTFSIFEKSSASLQGTK